VDRKVDGVISLM